MPSNTIHNARFNFIFTDIAFNVKPRTKTSTFIQFWTIIGLIIQKRVKDREKNFE